MSTLLLNTKDDHITHTSPNTTKTFRTSTEHSPSLKAIQLTYLTVRRDCDYDAHTIIQDSVIALIMIAVMIAEVGCPACL
jgi:hypothetical protein